MTDPLHDLITALREELQSYGELLALLDRQQESVFARASNELLDAAGSVQTHAVELEQIRHHRDTCRQAVAEGLGLPADASFSLILPALPPDYRPLLAALVEENNALLVRVQQRAHQNHLLLSRSVELMQKFLSSLVPGHDALVYTVAGMQRQAGVPGRAVYDAVG